MGTSSYTALIADGAIAVICPRCGSPVPAQLATPDTMQCRSCGYQGAPYPEARQRLEQVAQMLFQIDARERQFSGVQRRTILASKIFSAGLALMLLFIVLPVGSAAFYLSVAPYTTGADLAVMAGVGTPTMVMAVFGFACLCVVIVKRRKLLAACAAIPPATPGQPFRCRVCGGQLTTAGSVARCDYCGADSVVSPEAIKRSQAQRAAAVQAVELEVTRQATSAGSMAVGWAVTLTIITLLISPVLMGASVWLVGLGISRLEISVDDTVHYVAWTVGTKTCLGQLIKNDTEMWFGEVPPPGFSQTLALAPGQPVDKLTASFLKGKRFHSREYDIYPAIQIYRGALSKENMMRLQGFEGYQELPVRGACLENQAETVAFAPIQGWSGPAIGDDKSVFLTDVSNSTTTLWRVGLSDLAATAIVSTDKPILELQQDAATIYMSQHDGYRSISKGGGPVTFIAKTITISGFCVAGDYLYTSHNVSGLDYAIVRITKQGGAKTTLVTLGDMPCAFACSPTHVYWFTCNQENSFGGGDLYRTLLDGGKAEVLARKVKRPAQNTRAIFANGRLLWTEQDSTKAVVYALGADNSVKVLANDDHSGKGFWIDQASIYWGSWGKLTRLPISGGTPSAIAVEGSSVGAMVTAGPYLFLGDDSRKRMIRMIRP